MNLFGVDLEERPALIAEVGVNHEGDPSVALRLLRLAAEAGADAVKFQSYTPERFIAAEDSERLERVSRFALDEESHEMLFAEGRKLGLPVFSSAISEDWVPYLGRNCPAIKIASGDIDFAPVIRAAARTNVAVILSTGTASEAEVAEAVSWFRDEAGENAVRDRLVLMHCVSAYPTPIEEANLQAIPTMQARFAPASIGYSNHVIGCEAPIAAVALGAKVVEVHFTDKKEGRAFRDHALSADPDDLRYLARMLPGVAAARGDGVKRPQECESGMADAIRKGVVVATDLSKGHTLVREDLMFARPAVHWPAHDVEALIGRTLAHDLRRGMSVRPDALVPES